MKRPSRTTPRRKGRRAGQEGIHGLPGAMAGDNLRNHSVALSLVILAAAILAVYANSFRGVFVFDDVGVIQNNGSIVRLWPLWPVLSPPPGITSTGRPLLNLSFAVNYALGGLNVWGYHAVNLAIHLANALLLFGVVRRSLSLPALRERFGGAAVALSFAIALLWAVHPLQTESVTYIAQRAESLVGLFYLAVLYCVIRGAGSARPAGWYAGAIAACLLGMSAKEVMVTAPAVVLLYDRYFLAGSFREALSKRWWMYAGMALTWVLLGYLITSTGDLVRLYADKGSTGGAAPVDSGPLAYAATQPGAILHYLRLTLWPHPLVLDYGRPAPGGVGEVLPAALAIAFLAGATLWGVLKRKPWAFLGAWFFMILSPTSSIVPLFDAFSGPIFEHRMYLPLAGVIALLVLVVYAGGRAAVSRGWIEAPSLTLGLTAAVLLAVVLGGLTFQRNKDYASAVGLWQDTILKVPGNARVHMGLGNALSEAGQLDRAIESYREALRIRPDYAEAHNNLGKALTAMRLMPEAIAHYREALKLKPDSAEPYSNIGVALVALGRTGEAVRHYQEALRLRPGFADAHNNLGVALAAAGRHDEAMTHYREALKLKPHFAEAHNNLGNLLAMAGATDEAVGHYRQALNLRPDFAEPHSNLGVIYFGRGEIAKAAAQFKEALRIDPNSIEARKNLERLAELGGKPAR